MKAIIEDQQFDGKDFTTALLEKGDYEHCPFRNCNFSQSSVAEIIFLECNFEDCDISMAKLNNASFRDSKFTRCKLLGLRFDECNKLLLSLSFDNCVLNFSSFFRLKLKGIVF